MALTDFIAETLHTGTAFLAGLSGNPIWAFEKEEAEKLGSAITNVTRHYDIPGLEQKTVDWIRLAQVAGMTVGTRLFAAGMARKPAAPKPSAAPKQEPMVSGNGSQEAAPRHVTVTPVPGMPPVTIIQ